MLLLVSAAAWAWTLSGAGMDIAAMAAMADMASPMGPWSAAETALILVMWTAMMAAMMLPSAAPMILLFATIQRRRTLEGGGARLATGVFMLGYLAVWTGFSAVATAAQWALEHAAVLSHAMAILNAAVASLVLIGAGIYQWTPLKNACLRHCRSPFDFILHGWREGLSGAWHMGLRHGAYCLGCCWALMLLLFVGGVMSIAWIGGLTLYVMAEKMAPAGHWISRLVGVALIVWGAVLLVRLAAPGSAT